MARGAAQTLDRLAILDDEGRRLKLHPADVRGRLERLKPFVRWGLIAVFVLLPWIDIGGQPAVLFDLPARRFHLFGHVLGTGDLPWLFALLMVGGFALVVSTALWGRLWCGWACPQTVYLEAVFRRIERVVEGTGAARMAMDLGPWTASKTAKKLLKWALWAIASFVIAHIFLSYFVSLPRVLTMVLDAPTEHWSVFLIAAFATGITYFNFAWFREQTCLIVCPYGRLQSAMHDDDSITVGYDKRRGEPRGKPNTQTPEGVPVGDCIDCRRCVQVCPTGIDIRNGLQMECIACAACVDACDDIMIKLHRPIGLVRYDSERGFAGEARRRFRPRIAAYAVVGVVGAAALVMAALGSRPIVARVTRPAGPPFVVIVDNDGTSLVQSTLMIHIENRASAAAVVRLVVNEPGVKVIIPIPSLPLGAQERGDLPLLVRAPLDAHADGRLMHIVVHDDVSGTDVAVEARLLGPRAP